MAAAEGIRLFRWNHQEIFVRDALGALEIDLLFFEADGARVLRMRIVVEVAQVNNVYPQCAEDSDPRRLVIEGTTVGGKRLR